MLWPPRLVEQPFSFQGRDEQLAAEKEATAIAAKDPNRFQVCFGEKRRVFEWEWGLYRLAPALVF